MFELEKFDIKLETDFVGRNFIYVDEIGSTNEELLNNKSLYKNSGTILMAEKQLLGHGRKHRTWQSNKGQNLTFSILICDEILLDININHFNLLAAVVISNAIENLYQLRCELKWPNDVLIGRNKIAGILTETSVQGKKIERAVVGIGLNVNQTVFQGEFNYPPSSLKLKLKYEVERENLLAEILNLFEENLFRLQKNPALILDEWRGKCRMIGDRITIVQDDKIEKGIFYDIDENGFLILKQDTRFEKIHFGDVSSS